MADLIKMAVDYGNGSYARVPSIGGGHSRILAAATAAEHTLPTDADGKYPAFVTFSADADFWVRPIKAGEDELVTNGTFATDIGWTKGTGWTIGSGTGSSDGTQTGDADLEQTLANLTLVEGQSYSAVFTVSGFSAGNVTVVVGGTEGTDRASNATFTQTIIAGSSQVIALRADANFVGNVDGFTLTPIAVAPATNQTGGAPDLNPTTLHLGGKYTKLSLYSTAGGNLGMQFYI